MGEKHGRLLYKQHTAFLLSSGIREPDLFGFLVGHTIADKADELKLSYQAPGFDVPMASMPDA